MSRAAEPTVHVEGTDADIGILLTAALAAFKVGLHAQLARAGYDDLGPAFGFVFRSLAERALSLSELATRLGITSQGALKIVAEMEEKGYVQSDEDEADRRVRRLSLTRRGRGALREARRFHATTEKRLVASIGARQVAGARAVLAAIAEQSPAEVDAWAATARPF